jgi:hypothetical protein
MSINGKKAELEGKAEWQAIFGILSRAHFNMFRLIDSDGDVTRLYVATSHGVHSNVSSVMELTFN